MTFVSKLLSNRKTLPLIIIGASSALLMTPANALDIKQEQINTCTKGAVAYQVADEATAKKLCTCTINVRAKMTIGQMWEIESYAQSGKDPSTLPYAKKMQQELQQCTVGLKLNPPKKPKS